MDKFTVRFAGLERCSRRGLLPKFDIVHRDGYVMSTVTSGYGFRSYGAAIKGARRALATANSTGKFPNMCAAY